MWSNQLTTKFIGLDILHLVIENVDNTSNLNRNLDFIEIVDVLSWFYIEDTLHFNWSAYDKQNSVKQIHEYTQNNCCLWQVMTAACFICIFSNTIHSELRRQLSFNIYIRRSFRIHKTYIPCGKSLCKVIDSQCLVWLKFRYVLWSQKTITLLGSIALPAAHLPISTLAILPAIRHTRNGMSRILFIREISFLYQFHASHIASDPNTKHVMRRILLITEISFGITLTSQEHHILQNHQ